METKWKWMRKLGFSVVDKKKGSFVDGYKHVGVVQYHQHFLWRMVSCGMLIPQKFILHNETMDVEKMNIKPGGASQRCTIHTSYDGKPQSIQFPNGTPKGMARHCRSREWTSNI